MKAAAPKLPTLRFTHEVMDCPRLNYRKIHLAARLSMDYPFYKAARTSSLAIQCLK